MRAIAVAALIISAAACSAGADTDGRVEPVDAVLLVRADGCGPRVDIGAATVVAEGLALTAAHVVAGAADVMVLDPDGREFTAAVVLFDPALDLALLAIDPGVGTPLSLRDLRVEAGDVGTVTVLRETNEVTRLEAEVLRRANVSTTDIYLDERVTRPGFEIRAAIEPGDSGSVVVIDGAAAGVVWSRSIERDQRAWVVNVPEAVRSIIVDGELDPVDVGPCL